MGREEESSVVLWLSLLLLVEGAVTRSSQEDNKPCHPSRCGIITNISYPFRLPHDPPHCGHRDYQLDCENNVAILPLLDYDVYDYYLRHGRYPAGGRYPVVGRYRVLGINYNNFTIRLVDEGIHKGNCSSLPLCSSPLCDFDDYSYPYSASTRNSDGKGWSRYNSLNKKVGYLMCSEAVREDAAYVDMSPCVNRESEGGGGHLYDAAGDLLAQQFQPQCRPISVIPIASDWETLVPGGRIKSYADINTLLYSGFELSWWQRACDDLNCSRDSYCIFIAGTQGLQCVTSEF